MCVQLGSRFTCAMIDVVFRDGSRVIVMTAVYVHNMIDIGHRWDDHPTPSEFQGWTSFVEQMSETVSASVKCDTPQIFQDLPSVFANATN